MFTFVDKQTKKELSEYKKKLLHDKKSKEELLSAKTNWTMLEKMIQECNKDPDLHVELILKDGTKIILKTNDVTRKNVSKSINGSYNYVTLQ